MVLRLKELPVSLPGALFVGTPNADLLYTGDTIITNEYVDNTLPTVEGVSRAAAKLYAGDFDLKNPLISPLYGDYVGSSHLFGVGHSGFTVERYGQSSSQIT